MCRRLKQKLTSIKALTHFDPQKPIYLAADASSQGVGAVIYHKIDGKERPIAHASKTLSPAERNYAQIEREALALIFGLKKFHQYLWGRQFTLYTDHKPLTTIFGPKKGIPVTAANRLQRWALIMIGYTYDIQYKPTQQMGNADGLSRLAQGPDDDFDRMIASDNIANVEDINLLSTEVISLLPVTATSIAEETAKDPLFAELYHHLLEGHSAGEDNPELRAYLQRQNELSISNGCVLLGMRTVIPPKCRKSILDVLHEGHMGVTKMKMLARSYVWWPGLDSDIELRAKSCEACASTADDLQPVPLHRWERPERPWTRLHADFAEYDKKHFLIVIDAYSKWPEVVEVRRQTVTDTVKAFSEIFLRQGIPEQLVTVNGPQFKEFVTF